MFSPSAPPHCLPSEKLLDPPLVRLKLVNTKMAASKPELTVIDALISVPLSSISNFRLSRTGLTLVSLDMALSWEHAR